jgi:hypothetical protein
MSPLASTSPTVCRRPLVAMLPEECTDSDRTIRADNGGIYARGINHVDRLNRSKKTLYRSL